MKQRLNRSATTKGLRLYGQWAGNPEGAVEDKTRCVYEVCTYTGRWPHFHQCSFKRGYGPNGEYCKRHAAKKAL